MGGRRRRCCFHKDLSRLQDSTLSPCPIRPNPNISTRFQRQASYSITDKNNGVLQSEPQLSGCWENTRQEGFLSRGDDQGWTRLGSQGLPGWINVRMFPVFSQRSPPLLSRWDYKENVDPDQLMVYDTKETFPESRSLRPPCWSLAASLLLCSSSVSVSEHNLLELWSLCAQTPSPPPLNFILRKKVLFVWGCSRNSLQVVWRTDTEDAFKGFGHKRDLKLRPTKRTTRSCSDGQIVVNCKAHSKVQNEVCLWFFGQMRTKDETICWK